MEGGDGEVSGVEWGEGGQGTREDEGEGSGVEGREARGREGRGRGSGWRIREVEGGGWRGEGGV